MLSHLWLAHLSISIQVFVLLYLWLACAKCGRSIPTCFFRFPGWWASGLLGSQTGIGDFLWPPNIEDVAQALVDEGLLVVFMVHHISNPYKRTDFTFVSKILILWMESAVEFHICRRELKVYLVLIMWLLMSRSALHLYWQRFQGTPIHLTLMMTPDHSAWLELVLSGSDSSVVFFMLMVRPV